MKRTRLLTSILFSTLSFVCGETLYTTTNTGENIAAYGDYGISFKLNSDITVSELSFFALNLGGGDTPYVQLWNDDSDTLLADVKWDAGQSEAGWNSKKLQSPVTLKRGVTYQIQSSAYWVPTHTKSDFGFSEVVESTTFHQTEGWVDWTAPTAPSKGKLQKEPAALVNLTYESAK
jgi:hypothetical protein